MKFRISAILALVATLITVSVMAGGAELPTVEKVELDGIKNFSILRKSSGYAGTFAGFGGATQPAAMPALKRTGIATVINLRLANEEGVDVEAGRAAAEKAGMQYIHLPFDSSNPDPTVVERFLAIAGDEANHPVYIHCNSATRVAALWMIGRVLEDDWEFAAASKEAELIALKPASAIAFATAYIVSH